MIDIPIYDAQGQQVGSLPLDETILGGEVRHGLLKQAYVRCHANQRLGTSKTKRRGEVEGSTRKLYKQKHTGNARRGSIRSPILKGGGRGHAKKPRSFRQEMPIKMRRLANRNALLAKAVDGELKLVDKFPADKPSSKQFALLLQALKIDRSCLLALADTRSVPALSAANLAEVTLTQIDQINAFTLLSHRYVLVEKSAMQGWLDRAAAQARTRSGAATEAR